MGADTGAASTVLATAAVASAVVLVRQYVSAQRKRNEAKVFASAEAIGLLISGMTCGGCEGTVRRTLQGVPGVLQVSSVSHKNKRADVLVARGTDAKTIIEAVETVGFDAKLAATVRSGGLTTVKLSVKGMMCQGSCGRTVERALKSVSGVAQASASFERESAVALIAVSTDPEALVLAVEASGFQASLLSVETAEDKRAKFKKKCPPRRPGKARHACLRGKIEPQALAKAFEGVLASHEEQQLAEYSRYTNWTQSCYTECHPHWEPQVAVNPRLVESMQPLLDKAKAVFLDWYKDLYGLKEAQVITLNSFVTKYLPVQGKNEFGKHVDSAKCDGSLILALPTNNPHDWPGLTVWDGKKDPETGQVPSKTYVLEPGDICVLDKLIWHHGLPISKGARYVAVCFYKVEWKRMGLPSSTSSLLSSPEQVPSS